MTTRHGFTLIELMVAVFLTSIVVLAAYALVNSSSASLNGEIQSRLIEGNLENASQIISRDLSRVGYHVPFDSRDGDKERIIGHKIFSGIRAINYIDNQPTATGNLVAQLKLVLDVTDHDGFLVKSDTGGLVTVDRSTTSYLTLQDVLTMPVDPTMYVFPTRVMDTSMANSAFERAFLHAKAVYTKSKNSDDRVLIMLKKNGVPVDGESISSADTVAGTIQYSPTDSVNGKTLSNYGFDSANGFLKDERVSPIISVVYRLNGSHLERCYAQSLDSSEGNLTINSNLEACSVLVYNVSYFEIYPITDVNPTGSQRGSFVNYLNNDCSSGPCAIRIPIGNANNFSELDKVDLSKVIGFYYRIGAYSDNRVPGGRMEGLQPGVVNLGTPGNDNFRPLVHVQGTALLKNKTNLSGTLFQCTGINCNLHYSDSGV